VVEAGIDAVPVRWRFRQQQEEFCYLVQSVWIGRSCHSSLLGQNWPVVEMGVRKMYTASAK
jgi:hypothetical protein